MSEFDRNHLMGHLAYKLANATVNYYPFPHIYIQGIFPHDFYTQLLANLPPAGDYSSGASNYNGRTFADTDGIDLLEPLNDPQFVEFALFPFRAPFKHRFPDKFVYHTDLRLVRDPQNYAIGPHTDAPWKVLSYLFYLPPDSTLSDLGTSIYLPKDRKFTCFGGPHYKHNLFTKIHTARFLPNSLFAFFKTDQSFHGVEPITIPCQRDVLLWNLYDSAARNGKVQSPP